MNYIKKYKDILIPILSGSLVGIIINKAIDYSYISKPVLSPPSIVFPIAWSIIYLLMGTSYYLYKKKKYPSISKLYYAQLIMNLLWSIIFFNLKFRLFSIIWIFILDILVIKMFIKMYKQDKKIALLNIIYLVWIVFATYLNIGIYLLNK